jgi:redox-sensitive bicupin YhaK (pirin superfamily)
MIEARPYAAFGGADHGWLKAKHHFSFADYRDPARMGWGALRVVNDDRIAAGAGFPPHPHDNMEIITYVRKGAISHRDNLGNQGRTAAGDVQVMSAGTGVQHAEFNLEDEEIRLYQIWIYPRARGLAPRWEQREFPKEPVSGGLTLLVSGREVDRGGDALEIYQDAAIYGGVLGPDARLAHELRSPYAYLLVSKGEVSINGIALKQGDAAAIKDETALELATAEGAEVLLIEVPPLN